MPRKPKLTEKMIETAEKLIAAGNYQRHVAQYLGIDESTWYRWLQKGERAQQNSLYSKLYKAVKKAEAEAVARNVTIIQKAAQDTWQAAAWWLERKCPEEWGKKNKLDVQADGEFTLKIIEVSGNDNNVESNK